MPSRRSPGQTIGWLAEFFRDVACAFRLLRTQRGFAILVVATLALGIGANTAVFSVVDAVLLRPLPYPSPERIVHIKGESTQSFMRFPRSADAYIQREIQESPAFSAITFYTAGAVNFGDEPAERLRAAEVTPSFFDVLGVPPRLGRTFSADDVLASKRLAVISDRLWRDRFSADRGIIGREILLDGVAFQVLGVMPPGVGFPEASRVWIPASGPTQIGGFISKYIVLARLNEGVQAADALEDVRRRSGLTGDRLAQVKVVAFRDLLGGAVRPIALVVWIAASLVLLIACINTANLLLARVAGRAREFAVRSALGASRAQLIRQVISESVVLAGLGAAAALPAALWTLEGIRGLLPITLHGVDSIAIDSRALVATAAFAALTALLFGLGPALSIPRRSSPDVLRGSSGGATANRFWAHFRSVLVVGEVALALVLLVGAVTLVRTVQTIMGIDTGVTGERAIALELSLPRITYGEPVRLRTFYERLESDLRALPGVEAAGLTNQLPGRPVALLMAHIQLQGEPARTRNSANPSVSVSASPGYFAAAGIELIAGRFFTERDTASGAPVIIVSEQYARAAGVESHNLIGRNGAVSEFGEGENAWAEIVGVVRDVRLRGPEREFFTAVYSPLDVNPGGYAPTHVVVRSSADPMALVPSIRGAIARIDPTLPVYNVQTFDQIRASLIADRRFAMTMLGVFAGLGSGLAILGLYAVISYLVHLRTREIGIRIAVGATQTDVLWHVVRTGMTHAVLGVVLGVGCAAIAMRYGASRVPRFGAPDMEMMAALAVAVVVISLVATLVPARRAARVDPVLALRTE